MSIYGTFTVPDNVGEYAIQIPTPKESDFGLSGSEITEYYGEGGDVKIPSKIGDDNVVGIGYEAFASSGLTSVTIPEGVESIGGSAFQDCKDLESATIPSSVTSIGSYAFNQCSKLKSVTIPEGVESIGENAFFACENLKSVTIPSTVTSIGMWVFEDCGSLESVTISEGVKSISAFMFSSCWSLESVTIPASVTSIGDHAFAGCMSLESVTISEGVKSISAYMFYGCWSLESVTIPASVTSIGDDAFATCNKLNIVTMESATPPTAGEGIFDGVSALFEITVPKASTAAYRAADGWSTYKDYINPDPVTIDAVAVVTPWDSTKGAITVDYTLKKLDAGGWYKVAFDITAGGKTAGVTNAAAQLVKGPQAQKVIETVPLFGQETIAKDAKVKISLIADEIVATAEATFWLGPDGQPVGESAWIVQTDAGCYIVGEGSATNLPSGFNRDPITKMVVDEGITEIGARFFKDFNNLETLKLGEDVAKVGEKAFLYCVSLESIEIGNPNFDLSSLDGAINYHTAVKPDGSLYPIPNVTVNGCQQTLEGKANLTDANWADLGAVVPGKAMSDYTGYHFFRIVLKKVEE